VVTQEAGALLKLLRLHFQEVRSHGRLCNDEICASKSPLAAVEVEEIRQRPPLRRLLV
jgi:hypothetical protein